MDILKAQEQIREQVVANKKEMLGTLCELIKIPSVSGSEGKAQEFVQEMYSKMGLKVITIEPDKEEIANCPYISRLETTDFKGRPNVLGILEGSKSAKSISLNAHIDTITAEPLDQWTHPPFSPKINGNRLYGRGAIDNKAGITANYYALKSILDAGYKPKGKIMLESAVEEETGGAGSLTTMLRGYLTDGMICNDGPPGVLIANSGGVGRLTVKVIGRTAHAGWADTGVNAIIKMNKIVAALDELGNKRMKEKHVAVLETGRRKVSCTHNIGVYRGGDTPATVPGWAEITAGFLTMPGEDVADVRKQVEEAINRAADDDDWLKVKRPQIKWQGKGRKGWLQDAEHPFVQMALKATERVIGHKVIPGGMTAGSDARFSQFFNMPAILTGQTGNAHAVDEYLRIDSMVTNAQLIATWVAEWSDLEKL